MAIKKDKVVRQQTSYRALVRAVQPKEPKVVKYEFSNGRKFLVKQ